MPKREVDIVVISDVHLGTYGCKANELLTYLNNINPKKVILNGDFIDIWQFSKWYFPKSHLKVIRCILKYLTDDIPVYYLTGNHDDMLRAFADFNLGNFHLLNKLILKIEGEQVWFFHGDFLDTITRHSKWLAKLGTVSYHTLIIINWIFNWILSKLGRQKISFSQRIKASVKGATNNASKFEQNMAKIAMEKGYSVVVCGHSHQAVIKEIKIHSSSITYLNSGDWVESLTALEYYNNNWSIYKHNTLDNLQISQNEVLVCKELDTEDEYFKKFT